MSISAISNNKINFGINQNKNVKNKNSSLGESLKNDNSRALEDSISSLEKVIDKLKANKEKISTSDMSEDLKKQKSKEIEDQILDAQNQIQQLKMEIQKEKIEKQKEQAEKQAEKNREESNVEDKDIGGAIVSRSLIKLIEVNKSIKDISSLKEIKSRLNMEKLDLAQKPNDKYALRDNSYRAVKLRKISKSNGSIEYSINNIIKDSAKKSNKVSKELTEDSKEIKDKYSYKKDNKNILEKDEDD